MQRFRDQREALLHLGREEQHQQRSFEAIEFLDRQVRAIDLHIFSFLQSGGRAIKSFLSINL